MESATKCKTIKGFLGKDYVVVSCDGHIRNLASSGKYRLGIDLENMNPNYKIDRKKMPTIASLKQKLKTATEVFLATDKDREGEAIAFHLCEVLKLNSETKRIIFNEITPLAIKQAIANPGLINKNLVHSQQARQMLDKMMGYRLSRLLQTKINAKSAGRVQSVALKLIADRSQEIESFIPQEY
jgi:DNA topoisomerase-1